MLVLESKLNEQCWNAGTSPFAGVQLKFSAVMEASGGLTIPADGSYGIGEGIMFSYPVTCQRGEYQIVPGLPVNDFSRARLKATEAELREERAGVESLF